MLLGFVAYGRQEELLDIIIGRAGTEWSSQVDLAVRHEAWAQVTIRRNPHSVAIDANVVGDLAYEPHGTDGALHAKASCRTIGNDFRRFHRTESSFDSVPDLAGRDEHAAHLSSIQHSALLGGVGHLERVLESRKFLFCV